MTTKISTIAAGLPDSKPATLIITLQMKSLRHILLFLLAFILAIFPTKAQKQGQPPENPAEDFVRASVVVASPGEAIYSALGHSMIRLECPDLKLDYIFSEESEDEYDKIWRFIQGKLGVGVRAVPTLEYLQIYRDEQRSVYSYELNLPIRIKQRLWQQMDWRLQQPDEIYDLVNKSCAVSLMQWLMDAVDQDSIQFAEWPEDYGKSPREIAGDSIKNRWVHLFGCTVAAGETYDKSVNPTRKIMHPYELVRVLQNCKAYGRPMLSSKQEVLMSYPPKDLVDTDRSKWTYWLKQPECPSTILLLLALVGTFLDWRRRRKENQARGPLVWALISPALLIYALAGIFMTYLTFFSDMPCTEWNWLIIPFNVLPLLLWHWRERWAVPFAVVCVLWCLAVTVPKYGMVDPTHLLLALSSAAAVLPLRK